MKTHTQTTVWGAVAAVGLTLSTLPLNAQSNAPSASGAGSLSRAERAAKLFNRDVMTSDNQKLGKVANVVLDLESGHILYLVVNGSKGKVAVPPQIFGHSTSNTIVAKVDKQKIDNAPQFTSNINKPGELSKADFVAQVYQYFGQSPWWQGGAPATAGVFHNVHKLNDLLGMKVQNVNNQPIGSVSHLVVDLPAGQILYVVLTPDSSLKLGDNLYTLPPEAFTLGADQKSLVSNIDQQKLAAAPHFPNGQWPNLTDPALASQVYQYYGKQAWFQTGGAIQPTGR
jgi:sporulation protein YlmC with PRC-barrel domain